MNRDSGRRFSRFHGFPGRGEQRLHIERGFKGNRRGRFHQFYPAKRSSLTHSLSVHGAGGTSRINWQQPSSRGKFFSKGGGRKRNSDGTFRDTFPMGYKKVEELANDLEARKIQDMELIRALDVDGSFYKRLDVLAEQPNEKLLSQILYIVSKATKICYTMLQEQVHKFTERMLQSALLQEGFNSVKLMSKSTIDLLSSEERQRCLANLDCLIIILVEAYNKLPTRASELESEKNFYNTANMLLDEGFALDQEYSQRLRHCYRQIAEKRLGGQKKEIAKSDKNTSHAEACEKTKPPQSFRDLPILPLKEEILQPQKPYLRRNKIDGAYDNVDHYLDVQFRLLREDYLCEIREGVTGTNRKGQRDLKRYKGVRIGTPSVDQKSGQIVHKIFFYASKKIRWEVSKRLLYGSLLCFSSDNYQEEIFFGVVANRGSSQLSMGEFQVIFDHTEVLKISPEKTYEMAESNAYFEAYRYVLSGLQAIQADNMPFERYLVQCNPDIRPPDYLADGQRLDFACLIKEDKRSHEVDYSRIALNTETWPSKEDMGLDHSQMNALKTCLTKELAIVQGPPGTGKTYIGWQIAKLLLDEKNINVWNEEVTDLPRYNPDGIRIRSERTRGSVKSPLLVVCYTNHALDQFLEGILSFMNEGIIRVGARSKSEKLSPFVLSEVRKIFGKQNTSSRQYYQSRSLKFDALTKITRLEATVKLAQSHLPRFSSIADIVLEDWPEAANQFESSNLPPDAEILRWLKQEVNDAASNSDRRRMNLQFVKELVNGDGIPESLAKAALAFTGNVGVWEARDWIIANYGGPIPFHPIFQTWPYLQDIFTLSQEMQVSEETALEALEECQNSMAQARFRIEVLFGRTIQQPEPADTSEATGEEETEENPEQKERRFYDEDWMGEFESCEGFNKDKKKLEEHIRRDFFIPKPKEYADFRDWTRFVNGVLSVAPMSEEEAVEAMRDIWALRLTQRRRLFVYWCSKFMIQKRNEARTAQRQFSRAAKLFEENRKLMDIEILRNAKVIGMTTTTAAKFQTVLQAVKPKIVIMEEAAEVLEAHLITSLSTGCQHVILIGDHQQLRPSPSVYELAKHYNMEISLFERLTKNNFEYAQLQLQHRMRPEISANLMPHFYKNLRDAESVHAYEDVSGMKKNVFFLNHETAEEDESDSKSHKNVKEADFVVALATYLRQQAIPSNKITLLCCYSAQFFEVKKKLKKNPLTEQVKVEVVDNFQGEENDVIILSLVRSNNEKKIGFLSIPNRVCVALSRAKKGLYVFGNFNLLSSVSELWSDITECLISNELLGPELELKCQSHGTEMRIQTPGQFQELTPEGGCAEFCNVRMNCGHVCEKRCHPYDADHAKMECNKKCAKKCDANIHPCKKLCHEECGDCKVTVEKTLNYGHSKRAECFEDPSKLSCNINCQELLPCEHQCQSKCSQPHTVKCLKLVEKTLPLCGHIIHSPCYRNVSEIMCLQEVMKKWPCGHENKSACSTDVSVKPCPLPCNAILPECEHLCKGTCGGCRQGRLHKICAERCKQVLICGHNCGFGCSRTCPPCKKKCETACSHSQCGKGRTGRACGQFCPPCMEPCSWACRHHRCSKNCNEQCDRPRCTKPCRKTIKCTKKHNRKCIGVCGEKCPDICPECEPNRLGEIMEELHLDLEENTLFVEMRDCPKHCILPVDYIDGWVDSKATDTELSPLLCLQCQSPIRTMQRYGPEINKRFQDLQRIKLKIKGQDRDLVNQRKEIQEELKFLKNRLIEQMHSYKSAMELNEETKLHKRERAKSDEEVTMAFDRTETGQILTNLSDDINKPHDKHLCLQMVQRWGDLLKITGKIGELENFFLNFFLSEQQFSGSIPSQLTMIQPLFKMLNISEQQCSAGLAKIIKRELELMGKWIKEHVRKASQFMLGQIAAEVERLEAMAQTFCLLVKFFLHISVPGTSDAISNEIMADQEQFCVLLRYFTKGELLSGEVEVAVKDVLQNLKQKYGLHAGLSKLEKVEIKAAMGFTRGHWYKCPNGHLYCIGECGRAMQESVCPDCGAKIGGESHRLLETNRKADEEMGS